MPAGPRKGPPARSTVGPNDDLPDAGDAAP